MPSVAAYVDPLSIKEEDTDDLEWKSQSELKEAVYVADPYEMLDTPHKKVGIPKTTRKPIGWDDPFLWDCCIRLVQARVLKVFHGEFPPLKPLPANVKMMVRVNFDRTISALYIHVDHVESIKPFMAKEMVCKMGYGAADALYDPPFQDRQLIPFENECFVELWAVDPAEEKKTGRTEKRTRLWYQVTDVTKAFPRDEVEKIRQTMADVLGCRVQMDWSYDRLLCRYCGRKGFPWHISEGESYCSIPCMPLGARMDMFYDDTKYGGGDKGRADMRARGFIL